MKTKIALAFLVLATAALAGPQDFKATAPAPTPAPDWFRANEWDVTAFGTGVWTQTAAKQDRYLGVDHAFGGTLDGKYFFSKYFGAGLSFTGLAINNSTSLETGFFGEPIPQLPAAGNTGFVGNILAKAVARYPIGQFAPYGFVGIGAIFNGGNTELTAPNGLTGNQVKFQAIEHDVKMIIEPGIGLEYRLTKNIGIVAEGAFDKIDRPQSNAWTIRSGLNVAF
jgi:hypothetical protein